MQQPNWKHFANWVKFLVGLEVALIFFVGNIVFQAHFVAWDIIQIGLFQYALFSPIDVSMIVNSIKGNPAPKEQ
jgi:hypothetical protein